MLPVMQIPVSLFGAPLEAGSASGSGALVTGAAASGLGDLPGAVAGVPAPFADVLTDAMGQVEQLEQQAKAAIEGLMTGKGVDVHEAMIATQKAGMGFELVLSVRNKALAAYQQVMGMQF
jgi:flagellar hook-basal body complex protein FliE